MKVCSSFYVVTVLSQLRGGCLTTAFCSKPSTTIRQFSIANTAGALRRATSSAATTSSVQDATNSVQQQQQQQQQQQRRDLQKLQSWAEQVGVKRHNLNLFETSPENSCWGVTVPDAAEAGTVVLQVPASIILSSSRVRDEILNDHQDVQAAFEFLEKSTFQSQMPQFCLFLKILLEHQKLQDSPWYAWIQSLPRHFDTSATLDEVEMECLPPYAWALANVERLHLDTFREALQLLPKGFLLSAAADNDELTEWAFNVVFTRCWRYESPEGEEKEEQGPRRCDIVPFGDMFNHGEMNIDLDYDADDNVVVSLSEDVKAGQPLYLSYGKPSNPYRFMVLFGFVDESQPEIMSQVIVSDETQRHVDLGYDFDKMVFRTQDGAISKPVWDVVLYSILSQVPNVQEAFYQAHIKGDARTKAAIHDRFLLETCLTLRKHVNGTLKEMKDLHDKIVSHDETKHPRLSMIRKNNEFVQRTFSMAKGRIDDMIKSEMARRAEIEDSCRKEESP